MQYDTPGQRELPSVEHPMALMETMIEQAIQQEPERAVLRKRGRPARLSSQLLASGIVWCVLHGWISQLDLWRRISTFGVGHLPAVPMSDQAVYNRMEREGTQMMLAWCAQISRWLWGWLARYEDRSLAPFAREIYALDESIMDALKRWLKDLRAVPVGDVSLLAGRLVGLFDIRRQQWKRLDWLPEAAASCQAYVEQMLESVAAGSLLLFDLGYYNFEWFDRLTQRGIWWVARLRKKGSYVIEHVLVQRDGYFEALVFLGAYRADRTAYLMRLVRVRYRGMWYSYLSNVTDPLQLSGAQVVALYARRWDSELGFRMLKDHLGLNVLTSAKMQVIGAQLWATVILAQIVHALQVQVAAESGVESFDVSLELLWRYLPEMSQLSAKLGQSLLEVMTTLGGALGLIRPSTRIRREVPHIDGREMTPLPVDLVWIREPRYAHKGNGSQSARSKQTSSESGAI
jgi:hypothetical protein